MKRKPPNLSPQTGRETCQPGCVFCIFAQFEITSHAVKRHSTVDMTWYRFMSYHICFDSALPGRFKLDIDTPSASCLSSLAGIQVDCLGNHWNSAILGRGPRTYL